MAGRERDGSPIAKRRKLDLDLVANTGCTPPPPSKHQDAGKGLDRPISPPLARRKRSRTPTPFTPRVEADAHGPHPKHTQQIATPGATSSTVRQEDGNSTRYVSSPFQLTRIQDLAPYQNVDAVGLGDILGDPMIRECWNFNFLFDVNFVMKHFDADVKNLVKVKIVHGFWKRDDDRRTALMEAAEPYPNIELKTAYIPDPFGTHHSKMLILFRHDGFAQVVIHTANMIERDWRNMTQAVWRSPLLPLKALAATAADSLSGTPSHPIGSGERFKTDLLRYLGMYEKRLKGLTQQLLDYDFSSIRAAFIGSAPSRQKPTAAKPSVETSFGWLGLQEILSTVPIQHTRPVSSPPNIIVQISSIATLGQNPTWLTHFQSVLSRYTTTLGIQSSDTAGFFTKASSQSKAKTKELEPTLNIIFPTPHEIRTSLDGYASGGSIHTKIQSAAQQKQLEYLRPLMCHWKYSMLDSVSQEEPSIPRREAYRGPAAPHIKTYTRFSNANKSSIDWAMVTSANLSKQAWGELENKKGEVWIQSWETGVVVWPALYDDPSKTTMVPVFGKDMPVPDDESKVVGEVGGKENGKTVVGFRMPYDLPLTPYLMDEVPWCATLPQTEPDWMGRTWAGY